MIILIIGSPEDAHAALIQQKITERGEEAVYFDTRQFPDTTKISLFPHAESVGFFQDGNRKIPLTSLRSAYWRYHFGYRLPELEDAFLLEMAHREIDSTVASLLRMLPCPVINSPDAIAMHAYKTYQLQLLKRAGLRVPEHW